MLNHIFTIIFLITSIFVATPCFGKASSPWLPKTPKGLEQCPNATTALRHFPRSPGEKILYSLEFWGFDLGTAAFEIKQRGTHKGTPVTLYQIAIHSASKVAIMGEVAGSAKALIPDGSFSPVQSASRYVFRNKTLKELQSYSRGGATVTSKLTKNGKRSVAQKTFFEPVQDFLTGFYFLRSIEKNATGCTIVYSGQKAFTLWFTPEESEELDTMFGPVRSNHYLLRYGSNRDNLVKEMRIWISDDARRIPLKIVGLGKFRPVAILNSYRPSFSL